MFTFFKQTQQQHQFFQQNLEPAQKFSSLFSRNVQKSNENSLKKIKTIGNFSENIKSILLNINWKCQDLKPQFQEIITLLMKKIYELRSERNQLQEQIINLKKSCQKVIMNQEYNTFKQEKNLSKRKIFQQRKIAEKDRDLTNNSLLISLSDDHFDLKSLLNTSILQNNLCLRSEENLLEQSEITQTNNFFERQTKQSSIINQTQTKLKKMNSNQARVLCQRQLNEQQWLSKAKMNLKKNSLSMIKFEQFIEKMNCAKELANQEIKHRRGIFY